MPNTNKNHETAEKNNITNKFDILSEAIESQNKNKLKQQTRSRSTSNIRSINHKNLINVENTNETILETDETKNVILARYGTPSEYDISRIGPIIGEERVNKMQKIPGNRVESHYSRQVSEPPSKFERWSRPISHLIDKDFKSSGIF